MTGGARRDDEQLDQHWVLEAVSELGPPAARRLATVIAALAQSHSPPVA